MLFKHFQNFQTNRKFWFFFAQFALAFLIYHEIVKAIYTFFCRTQSPNSKNDKKPEYTVPFWHDFSMFWFCLLTWLQCSNFISITGVVQQQIVQIDLNWISSSSSIACNSNSNVVYLLNVIVSILYARKRWFSIQLRFFAEKCAHTPWSKLNIIQYEYEWCTKRIQINANICALSARHIHCAI